MGLSAGSEKGMRTLVAVFCALVGIPIAIAVLALAGALRTHVTLGFMAVLGASFFLLGAALIYLALKREVDRTLMKFLVLTGASSAGLVASFFLHNVIYGLFIQWFGADFWDRTGGGDEPFFFIMAVFVCPIGFFVGVVGSAVLFIKRRRER